MKAHSHSIKEIYEELNTQFEGLTSEEAKIRLELHGRNELPIKKATSALKMFLGQFTDLLVIILIVAGIVTGVIGIIENNKESIVEVVAIFIVVALNAVLGFYQEFSAEKAITALQNLTVSDVVAVRDKHKKKIPAVELVPGDIISIEAGDTLAADLRIIEGYEVRALESILTGESVSIRKEDIVLAEDAALADRSNMLFKGTTVVNGSGLAVVVSTGVETELGKIATSLMEIKSEDTPIKKKLAKLAKQLTIGIAILSVLILVIGAIFMRGIPFTELFIFAIGLAVAAVPEGLPAVLTLTLAIGITRMAKKRSLIRKLPAVEVLGSATVICTDKTGTLTKNEMTVSKLWINDHVYDVTGSGYLNNGELLDVESGHPYETELNGDVRRAIEICTLANEAAIEESLVSEGFDIFGDPTEVALLIMAEKSGDRTDIIEKHKINYLFPFDSDRKRMSALVLDKTKEKHTIMVKGAIDVLLDFCTKKDNHGVIEDFTEAEKERILHTSDHYSSNFAFRVLGLAYRDISAKETEEYLLYKDSEKVEDDLVFLGFVAMIDPPRDQSRPAIESARRAGIKVIMITGDHMATAKAIGKSITLCRDSEPISGKELDQMTEEELDQAVEETEIFARVNPAHKLRIVEALKRKNEIVIMTGDGVNDAPALKRADIGVAMGQAGTDVAIEASDMVLIDDNFANIIDSVNEGRIIFDNMKRFISYLLSANAGEIITVIFGLILSFFFLDGEIILPIMAIQLLYINIVTDTFPALALGMSAPESNVMLRPPRDPDEPLLDKDILSKIFITGILYGVGSMIAYYWALDFGNAVTPENITLAQTMVFASLVTYQLLNSLSTSVNKSILSKNILRNRAIFGAAIVGFALLLVAIYVPFLQPFLQTTDISLADWGIIFATGISILIIEEIRKYIFRKKFGFREVDEYDYMSC